MFSTLKSVVGIGLRSASFALLAATAAATTPDATLTVLPSVTTGDSTVAAVPVQPVGSTFVWNVFGGVITGGAGTNTIQVKVTGPAGGKLVYQCVVSDATGARSRGTKSSTILSMPDATITSDMAVVPGTYINASVPSQTGVTYQWSIQQGTFSSTSNTASNLVNFTGTTGAVPLTLSCVVTNAAGTRASSSKVIAVMDAGVSIGQGPFVVGTIYRASVPFQNGVTFDWGTGTQGATIISDPHANSVYFLPQAQNNGASIKLACTVASPQTPSNSISGSALGTMQTDPSQNVVSCNAGPILTAGGSYLMVCATELLWPSSTNQITWDVKGYDEFGNEIYSLHDNSTFAYGSTFNVPFSVPGGTPTTGWPVKRIVLHALESNPQSTIHEGSWTFPVVPAPVATLSGPAIVTSGTSMHWSAPSQHSGYTYAWSLDGGAYSQPFTSEVYSPTLGLGTHTLRCNVSSPTGVAPTVENGSITVRVVAAPTINTFTSSVGTVAAGNPVTLAATYANATSILITDDHGTGVSLNTPLYPKWTTVYTMTATNDAGTTVKRPLTVTVTPAFHVTAGTMATPRTLHTATPLQSGRILLSGGSNGVNSTTLNDAYDGATGQFYPMPPLNDALQQQATLRLQGQGVDKMLVTGGMTLDTAHTVNTAEMSSDINNTIFTSISAAMVSPRRGHSLTLLADRNVLVFGGQNAAGTCLNSAEIFNPTANGGAGAFSAKATPVGTSPRSGHTATVMADGRVLLAGGYGTGGVSLATALIYDPVSKTFGAEFAMPTARAGHTATLLPSGKVLIVGGMPTGSSQGLLFDPLTGLFSNTVSAAFGLRSQHTAALLADGNVLVAGGVSGAAQLSSGCTYAYFTDIGTATTPMTSTRSQQTASLASDRTVLLAGGLKGGTSSNNTTNTAEVYETANSNPGSLVISLSTVTPTLSLNGLSNVKGWLMPIFIGEAQATVTCAGPVNPVLPATPLVSGEPFQVTFTAAGTYAFTVSTGGSSMTATVIVNP